MCGIAGFTRTLDQNWDEGLLRKMGDVISYRGPDSHGEVLIDHIGLAHRRLSIIDLSDSAGQPMVSTCGRYLIVFNGEIYNFLVLQKELIKEGTQFRTHSDTEVLLELYKREGPQCLEYLNGMFAFAVWDREEQTLFMARDRMGKKPLYYYHGGGDRLAFASEIKPLLLLPCVSRNIDPTALVDYLKYLYIPPPKTIFRNIYKLPPAHALKLQIGHEPVIYEYWDMDFSKTFRGSIDDASEELLALLADSTAIRMIADVPIGAFLSGGLDSSAIVALMHNHAGKDVKTCSIGFDDREHDETPYARDVARLFQTDHREYYVREKLTDTISLLPRYFDEPFADSSALPTYHVSRLARKDVTVALAGDGGDESFGGYEKYVKDLIGIKVRNLLPNHILRLIYQYSSRRRLPLFRKAATLSKGALADPAMSFYHTNTFIGDDDLKELLSPLYQDECNGYEPWRYTANFWSKMNGADYIKCMLYTDLKTYLPGDILVKVDRMSMAHSLEVRAPILDYRVIEFAATLPSTWKIHGWDKKHILKKTFRKLLPEYIIHRRKHGFTVPLDPWFRSDIRELGQSNILNKDIMSSYFSMKKLEEFWNEHQRKIMDHGQLLWSLLFFSLWHKEYIH